MDKRMGRVQWGAGQPRQRTSESYWRQPLAWNRKARESGKPWRVFCGSLCDVFDNEVHLSWRTDLWLLIHETPNLTWMLLTKRVGNVQGMVPGAWLDGRWPENVWIGATVVNQEEADRDIPKLLRVPAAVRFLSVEPMLEAIDLEPYLAETPGISHCRACGFGTNSRTLHLCPNDGTVLVQIQRVDWVIVGGESDQPGHRARPFVCGWGKDIVRQCKAAGVPVFMKQLGGNATNREGDPHPSIARAGADPSEWPADLRVREFPR